MDWHYIQNKINDVYFLYNTAVYFLIVYFKIFLIGG